MKLTQRLSQSRPLYEAFKQIKEGDSWNTLSEAQQRIIDGELRDFVLGGVALEVCVRLVPVALSRISDFADIGVINSGFSLKMSWISP